MKTQEQAKHTPGPWTIRLSRPIGEWQAYVVHGPDGSAIAFCNSSVAPNHANARLIAAAPELLAVLHNVAGMLPVAAQLHPDDLLKLQNSIVAAIAKAEKP